MTDQKDQPKFPTPHVLARRIKALELRKQGFSYRTIADTIGVNVSTAYHDVQASMQILRDLEMSKAEDVRGIELERLDRLLLAVWGNATDGDDRAVRAALSIMERRSRLLGLDAPQKSEHSGEVSFIELARSLSDQNKRLADVGIAPPSDLDHEESEKL